MADGTEYDRLIEQNRLIMQFITVLAELDSCFSDIKNLFAAGSDDLRASARTLARLKAESYQIKAAINGTLNGEKK
ncbi:MAG TPA: hypothetical protein HPP87_04690 [Planctomycetes bacterium]|nr:hypothetical protein [Planctomycetota bacterium]